MIQAFSLILAFLAFFYVPAGILGYFIAGLEGIYWAFALCSLVSTFCLFFGDSWLLALSNSIPLKKSEPLWEKSLNLISVKDLKNLSLYECRQYPHIVCCLTSVFGKNSLIIGSEVLKSFSSRERALIMELSTSYLKTKPTFLRTQVSLALALILNLTSINVHYKIYKKLPRLLRKLLSPILSVLNSIVILIKFLLFPLAELKKSLIRYSKPDEQFDLGEGNKSDLYAVVKKLQFKCSRTKDAKSLVWFAFNDLSLVPLGNDSSFMFNHYKMELDN